MAIQQNGQEINGRGKGREMIWNRRWREREFEMRGGDRGRNDWARTLRRSNYDENTGQNKHA